MRILDNEERKAMIRGYHLEKAKIFKANYRHEFNRRYYLAYCIPADSAHTEEFVNAVIHSEEVSDESKYSAAHFEKMMAKYLNKFRPT